MNNDIKTYEYDSEYGGKYIVAPKLATYLENDNIYVGLNFYDEEYTCWDSFSDVTVNIVPMPYLYSAIDTNNNGDSILDFLEENGFGESTGKYVQSGYCMYPVFRFNEDKLKEIDPDVFADYAKSHGMVDGELTQKPSLDSQLRTASARAAENHTPEPAMTAIREGYDEFALYPNEDLEGITLVHGGGQVKVDGVLYELHKPLSMSDCIKMDQIPYRPERHKVDDYFPRRDPYEPYR